MIVRKWHARALGQILAAAVAGCAAEPSSPPPLRTPDSELTRIIQNADTVQSLLRPIAVEDVELNAYLDAICLRLVTAAREAHQFRGEGAAAIRCHLLVNSTPAAFSTGGTHAYLSSGLLQACASENELAAVVAHEYAHLLDAHEASRVALSSPDPRILAERIASVPFSSEEEREADRDGLTIYSRAGWDPSVYGRIIGDSATSFGDARSQDADRLASQLPHSAEDWRRPPIADHRTFMRLKRRAQSADAAADAQPRLIASCYRNCFGPDRGAERETALKELRRLIAPPPPPVPTEGLTEHHSGGKG